MGCPPVIALPRATTGALIEEAAALAGQVFDQRTDQVAATAEHLTNRLHNDPDSFEMWFVRDRQGAVVCSGRVEFVEKTDFAGIWGGACSPAHRGRGLYRAITAQRARSALARGKTYLHSDCTQHSHPILERAGLSAITTVIPMIWTRHPTAPHHGQPQPRARVG